MLKFAIIGVGGMGKVHLRNVVELVAKRDDVKLVALCDVEESRFTEEIITNLGGDSSPFDLSDFKLYTDVYELLKCEKLDFVISATPTYLHEKIAILCLENDLHVFSEKPMAISLAACQQMINVAQEKGKLLMIGQCLRYSSEYVKLKELIADRKYGNVIRAEFKRYSPTPKWSWQNWLLDYEKSGCAALDLHVHDVDFINWTFGVPISVTSFATNAVSKFDSLFTAYNYGDILVTSAVDWGFPDSHPFDVSFLVRLDDAVIEMDGINLKVYPHGHEKFILDLKQINPYMAEIDDFISRIQNNEKLEVVTPESAMDTVKIVLAEIDSAQSGSSVYI